MSVGMCGSVGGCITYVVVVVVIPRRVGRPQPQTQQNPRTSPPWLPKWLPAAAALGGPPRPGPCAWRVRCKWVEGSVRMKYLGVRDWSIIAPKTNLGRAGHEARAGRSPPRPIGGSSVVAAAAASDQTRGHGPAMLRATRLPLGARGGRKPLLGDATALLLLGEAGAVCARSSCSRQPTDRPEATTGKCKLPECTHLQANARTHDTTTHAHVGTGRIRESRPIMPSRRPRGLTTTVVMLLLSLSGYCCTRASAFRLLGAGSSTSSAVALLGGCAQVRANPRFEDAGRSRFNLLRGRS